MDQSEEDTWKVKNILESGERIFYYGRTASCTKKGAGGVVWHGEVFAFWEAVRDILRMRLILEGFSIREAEREWRQGFCYGG